VQGLRGGFKFADDKFAVTELLARGNGVSCGKHDPLDVKHAMTPALQVQKRRCIVKDVLLFQLRRGVESVVLSP